LDIKQFLIQKKLGYQNFKASFILLKVSKAQEEQFRNYAKLHPNITYQEDVLGGDDFEIGIQVKNMHELRNIINDIKSKFASIIHDYKIHHIYKEYKNLYYPIKE